MNYLTNYYRNLSEQLEEKLKHLQKLLTEVANTDVSGGAGQFGTPEPLGDSGPVMGGKYDPTIGGGDPPPIGGSINEDNWQQMLQQIQNAYNNGSIVPSWWNPAWGTWASFYTNITNAISSYQYLSQYPNVTGTYYNFYNNLMNSFNNGGTTVPGGPSYNFTPPPSINWPFPSWPYLTM